METITRIDIPAALLADLQAGRLSQGLYDVVLDFYLAKEQLRRERGEYTASAPTAIAFNPRLADANWIKQNINLTDLSRHLPIEVNRRHVRCPRDSSHWANPHVKTNGVKCFKCVRQPYWSNIDLVMEIVELDFASAVHWFDERFPNIPRCKPRNHQGQKKWEGMKPLRRPNLVVPSIELLRKSRWWPILGSVERRLAGALIKLVPADTLTLTTTQEEIREEAGISHRRYMPFAWKMLEMIGMVEKQRVASVKKGKRGYTTALQVRLTWNSELFQSFLNPEGVPQPPILSTVYTRVRPYHGDEENGGHPKASDNVLNNVRDNVNTMRTESNNVRPTNSYDAKTTAPSIDVHKVHSDFFQNDMECTQ